MTLVNWLLGLAALVVWVGPFAWYFKDEIRTFRARRYDKWFRED